jgi:phenylacetate-coenzyme A ligase PaaK-like adenylate-forming protein
MNLRLDNILRIKILDYARHVNQLAIYKNYLENQYYYSKDEIIAYQEKQFQYIFKFHFENNKAYRNFLLKKSNTINPHNFDINNIPIIKRNFFKDNLGKYAIQKKIHYTKFSGGSTGNPLRIDLSKIALSNFWPGIWRAFDVYKVKPCDKIMMIAGTSLFNNRTFKRKVYEFINNFTVVSAFDLTPENLIYAYKVLKEGKIKVIYGYTSSVLYFLNFLDTNNFYLDLKCIFTTSETFIPRIRILARKNCNCDVIDTYGANDGGIFGFECQKHSGYHLNFERCLVEISDNKIICTDLLNTASPFIRYEVGDCTTTEHIITEQCSCGRTLFRIENISGRVNKYIIDKDGTHIHSAFFNQLFCNDLSVKQYQIKDFHDRLIINIICDPEVSKKALSDKYNALIKRRFRMPFTIVFNAMIEKLPNGKVPILIT